MNRRAIVLMCGALGAGFAALMLHHSPHTAERAAFSAPTPTPSPNLAALPRATATYGAVSTTPLPQSNSPLTHLMPDLLANPGQKLRKLNAIGDPFAARLLAVRSGDPLLVAHSIYMGFHCMDMPVQLYGKSVRQHLTEKSFDPKTGKSVPPDENLIAMHEVMQTVAPSRIQPPPEIAAEIVKRTDKALDGDPVDYVRETELLKQMAAPLSPAQRASFTATIARSAAECRGRSSGHNFGAEYRSALNQLVAQGVVSAMLFNRNAGWQSQAVGQLNDRDYELMQRALAESQPDGIARMLIGGAAVVGSMDSSWITETTAAAAMALEMNLGPLAACALGVSDCGPDSTRFRSMCAMVGGCEQADLASLLRHTFERDGLDPSIIDREIRRVVDAYQRRDLDALGVRRKQ